MKTRIEQLIADLVETSPSLQELYVDHIREFDELLPHVFMGDVTRFLTGLALSVEPTQLNEVLELLARLENAMREGDEQVKNLLVVSFLENLESDGPSFEVIRANLGPNLLEAQVLLETYYARQE